MVLHQDFNKGLSLWTLPPTLLPPPPQLGPHTKRQPNSDSSPTITANASALPVLVMVLAHFFVAPQVRKPQFVLGAFSMCVIVVFIFLCIFLDDTQVTEAVLSSFLILMFVLFMLVMLWRSRVVFICANRGRKLFTKATSSEKSPNTESTKSSGVGLRLPIAFVTGMHGAVGNFPAHREKDR